MGKQKKNKDKKDKKKHKDRDRQRKDKKKKQKKRSYSSSSSSSGSSDSSSSSRQKNKKKDSKHKKKQRKQAKPQVKQTNNPYDFDKTSSKVVPSFPVGLPSPGFNVPIINPTPPPPLTANPQQISKPKTKQINIFKLLPKLPYGTVLFAKTLYSTDLIQQKAYDLLLTEMIDNIEKRVKEQNHKKGINIIAKCQAQIQKLTDAEQQRKMVQCLNINEPHNIFKKTQKKEDNRFTNLQKIYQQVCSK